MPTTHQVTTQNPQRQRLLTAYVRTVTRQRVLGGIMVATLLVMSSLSVALLHLHYN